MPNEIDYDKLAQSLMARALGGAGTRTKAITTPAPLGGYGHGPGGLFSHHALEKPVVSAMVLPRLGLQSILPAYPSNHSNPLFGIFTGVTATTGSEPNGTCDDPPTAGLSKLCMHQFVFGRQSRQTRVFDIDRAGLLTDRGEHTDFEMLGGPQSTIGSNGFPTVGDASGVDGILNSEARKALWELAVAWSRDFAKEMYTGSPTNNTAGGGRKYFYGLDTLINTGYKDAETNILCPAADSIVASFGNVDVMTNGSLLVQTVTDVYRRLRFIANGAGLDPATWVITMSWQLFYMLTDIWPCAYATYRCANSFSTTQVNMIDSADMMKMRDDMRGDIYARDGQYLLIDGVKVPVVIDDAIAETVLPGTSFSTSMYFVPMTVLGGRRVTYLEYLNYDMPNGALAMAQRLAPDGMFYSTDSGRFLWHRKPPVNFCVQLLAKTEPRLILLTPHIAARITGLKYTPLNQVRSPFTDNSFFVNGGRTDRMGYGPSYYSPT